MSEKLRIVIVADQASTERGGEAILPYHYFRLLRQRGFETWLVVHERTRDELLRLFPEEQHYICFVPDTKWHIRVFKLGSKLPKRISSFTFGFVLALMTSFAQKRLIKQLISKYSIQLIHQPTPVSPRFPSLFYGFDIPVVIGPMNGSMSYPPGFRKNVWLQEAIVHVARQFSDLVNLIIPGKLNASVLLVANQRTREALPRGCQGVIVQLPENGVDLSIWNQANLAIDKSQQVTTGVTRLTFVGRLVDWKAVDLLLLAFRKASQNVPITLDIIGAGSERVALEQQAKDMGILSSSGEDSQPGFVRFLGWKSQQDCAKHLSSTDALVLPSLLECGGAVVLEAMASGLPVIATRWGGPMDYLDESCGILVEPSTRDEFINSLASAIATLAQDPTLRQSMGEAGKRKVREQFDWDVKVDKMIAIYNQAVTQEQSCTEGEKIVPFTV